MSSAHHQNLTDLEIVSCTPVHADVLAGLHGACFEKPWDTPSFKTFLEMPGGFGFVARLHEQPVGFILAQIAQDEGEIISLGVLSNHRRRGFAEALVKAAESHLVKCEGQAMFLEVAESNLAAKSLYEALGYRTVGRREGYYKLQEGPVDALVLKRVVAAGSF
ncbi:MAG: GNAT family N-acetyltransferase [Rhodospirillales bacterium]|jgi:ribosomal-protein-alanine N-acetyltransferase